MSAKNADWGLIRDEWESGKYTYAELGDKYGVLPGTIKSRRSREGWIRQETPKVKRKPKPKKKSDVIKGDTADDREKQANKQATKQESRHVEIVEESEYRQEPRPKKEAPNGETLTGKEQAFCYYYLKYFNAMKAYQIAYGSNRRTAGIKAYEVIQRPRVEAEIRRLKERQHERFDLTLRDIIQQYVDIAFADITDFMEFGQEEYTHKEQDPETGEWIEEQKTRSFVKFKDAEDIDGRLVSEVKMGRDGIGIKLHDKMKALDILSKYFDLLSERERRMLYDEKTKLEILKLEQETKQLEESGGRTIIVDNEEEMRRLMNERIKEQAIEAQTEE